MLKTYRVAFFKDGYFNEKLLEANCDQDLYDYLKELDCVLDSIEVVD